METEVGQRDLGTRRGPLELSGASPHSGDTESTCVPATCCGEGKAMLHLALISKSVSDPSRIPLILKNKSLSSCKEQPCLQ